METATENKTDLREELRQNGLIVLRSAIDPVLLGHARDFVWQDLNQLTGEWLYCQPMPKTKHYPIIDHAEALLKGLDAIPLSLRDVMGIVKRPYEGRRYWHTDQPPIFAPEDRDAEQLLMLYFLQRTTPENGCLLVVPGYDAEAQACERVTTPLKNEVPVPTEMGDVVILDPRLMHGSLGNSTGDYRLNLRLWIECKWKG